jgi:hypothetical protein
MPVAALAGLAACLALAADRPADAVLKLRSEWRAQVEKDTKTLREQFVNKLLKLEKELSEKGDYAGAAKARTERHAVQQGSAEPEKTAPTVPAAVTGEQPVVLEVAAAILSGGVVYDATRGVLRGWRAAGAAAQWLLPPGLRAGGYEVELTWSCAPDAGGEMIVKEDFYTMRRAVKPSPGWEAYQTEIIGTLRVLANSRLLELSAAAVRGSGLLQLKSIRLLPAASR